MGAGEPSPGVKHTHLYILEPLLLEPERCQLSPSGVSVARTPRAGGRCPRPRSHRVKGADTDTAQATSPLLPHPHPFFPDTGSLSELSELQAECCCLPRSQGLPQSPQQAWWGSMGPGLWRTRASVVLKFCSPGLLPIAYRDQI